MRNAFKMNIIIKKAIDLLLPETLEVLLSRRHYLKIIRKISEESIEHFSIIKYLITHDDYVIDVGANIGIYTIYMSKIVGRDGIVYAIEPVPRNLMILDYIISKLSLDNVYVLRCAASDENTSSFIHIPLCDGHRNYYRAYLDRKDTNCVFQVKTRTIDSLMALNKKQISFIKIDVEGHENQCIRGGMKTIERYKPALLIEVKNNPDMCGSLTHELFRILMNMGYEPYTMENRLIRKRKSGDRNIDYFFLQKEHIKRIKYALRLLEIP